MVEQFQYIGKKLLETGLISFFNGNISIREGDKIFITKKDAILSELKGQDIIETKMDGKDDSASVDLQVHQAIYANSKAKAIIHTHSPYAIALSLNEEKIIPQDSDGRHYLKSIPVVRVRDTSLNDEVIKFLAPAITNGCVCALVRSHGAYAVGENLDEALKIASIIEKSCQIAILSKKPEAVPYKKEENRHQQPFRRSAIPPSIGVMDRSYRNKR